MSNHLDQNIESENLQQIKSRADTPPLEEDIPEVHLSNEDYDPKVDALYFKSVQQEKSLLFMDDNV